jgi:predicted nucleic acid-binding protein
VDQHPADEVWLTAVTLAELLCGIGRLPEGRRKADLAGALEAMIVEDLDHRVAAFDEAAAAHYADIVVVRERAGRPISAADAQIAAICRSPQRVAWHTQRRRLRPHRRCVANPWSDR